MALVLSFVLLTIAAGLDDIELNLDQQGQLLNVFSELQQVGKETTDTFAKVDAPPPTEPPPLVAPLGMIESAASVAALPEEAPVQQQNRRPKTMSEAFQAFDALTNTRSTGLASLSAGNLYRQQRQPNMLQSPTPAIHRGPLEAMLLDDDTPDQQPIVQPQAMQQPVVNMDFQRLLGGQPIGVAPRPVSSVTRQQEFLPPVMLQQKAGQDDSDEVPATGLWQAQAKKWPKFKGDVFDAYRRGLRNRHARGVQEAYLALASDNQTTANGKDVFSRYKDGISKNMPATDDPNDMNGFASRLQTEIGLLSHTPQSWQSTAAAQQNFARPMTETAQEHLLKFHETLEGLSQTPPGWETPQKGSLLEEPAPPNKDSIYQVYRKQLRSSMPPMPPGFSGIPPPL